MADGFITTPSYMAPDFTSFFTCLPAPGWGVGLIACCYKPKLQGDRLLVEFYFGGGCCKAAPTEVSQGSPEQRSHRASLG